MKKRKPNLVLLREEVEFRLGFMWISVRSFVRGLLTVGLVLKVVMNELEVDYGFKVEGVLEVVDCRE